MNLYFSNKNKLFKVVLFTLLLCFIKVSAFELSVYIEKPRYENKVSVRIKKVINESLDDAINRFMNSNCAIKKSVFLYKDKGKYNDYKDYIRKKGEGIYIRTYVKNDKYLKIYLEFFYGKVGNIMYREDSIDIIKSSSLQQIGKTIKERVYTNLRKILRCN